MRPADALRLLFAIALGAALLVRQLPARRRQAPSPLSPETLAGRSPEDAARIAAAWAGPVSESVH